MTSLNTPRRYCPLAAVALAACWPGAVLAGPSGPHGVWIDNAGRGAVEIKACGERLCGHVVWVKSGADAKGCGRQIIGDAAPSGSKYQGWIYSPEDRKRYNVELSPTSDGRLKVVGYAGIRLFSKTMFWTPAPSDLVRCDAPAKQETAAPAKAAQPAPAPTQTKPPPATASASEGGTTAEAPKPATSTEEAPRQAAAEHTSEPAGEPQTADGSAAPPEEDTATADLASEPRLEKLARVFDKVVKRTPGGDCKLDLPWVKVHFRCEDE